MIRPILTAIFTLCFLIIRSQNKEMILPLGLNFNIYHAVPAINMPPLDSLLISKIISNELPKTKPSMIAYNFTTDLSPENSGFRKLYSKNYKTWFIKIRSAEALGIALVFSTIKLLEGEHLYVYNLDKMLGSYTSINIPPSGILPLGFLKGNEIMIEYNVPAGNLMQGNFKIETVSHALYNIFDHENHVTDGLSSRQKDTRSDCYVCLDINSLQNKKAVVRLIVHFERATRFCTGTLMNNTAQDNRPFILTAEHCISNQEDADRAVFTFNYEGESCIRPAGSESMNFYGANFLASSYAQDFSILELYTHPPIDFKPYFAGWDITDGYLDDVTTIHHPQGGPKKISIFNNKVSASDFNDGTSRTPDGFWKITQWDAGATEEGSSGAPLFNKNRLVIGTLTGGSSTCGSPYNDYFQRLSKSWEIAGNQQALKYWLDPLGLNTTTLQGLDPFEGINPLCDTISNIRSDEPIGLLPYSPGTGYFSGINSDSIFSYAEKFLNEDSALVTGAVLKVGSVNTNASGGIVVSVHSDDHETPGAVVFETYVPYHKMNSGSYDNYIQFYPYAKVTGNFFISYTMSYSTGDTFALYQSLLGNHSENTAYAKLDAGWTAMNNISPNGENSSLGIEATICKNVLHEKPQKSNFTITLHPNPVSSAVISNIPFADEKFMIEMYNLQGSLQPVNYQVLDNNLVISTSSLNAGLYIIRLSQSGKIFSAKFIKN